MSFDSDKARRLFADLQTVALSEEEVRAAIRSPLPGPRECAVLLSPYADRFLEEIAQRAHQLTLQHFGRTMQLYTPLYLANHCVNHCVYCGFSAAQKIWRTKLDAAQIRAEVAHIADKGFAHILLLTGESREQTPVSYLCEAVRIARERFSSISIEVYPLSTEEYGALREEGVDGLTLYQEVYDPRVYRLVHPSGPKSDYRARLDSPERACRAGIPHVTVGALLGLTDWRAEVFCAALHAHYLQSVYPGTDIGLSVPRVRPATGARMAVSPVGDRDLAHSIAAIRIFLPRAAITLSTRERSVLRDGLVPLGVTNMSASSRTSVGGHTCAADTSTAAEQFEIADGRELEDVIAMLTARRYQPVLKDWVGYMSEARHV